MLNKVARITFSVLIPIVAFAAPKEKQTIQLQVVSSQTKIHSSPPSNVFSYTDVIFATVNGKKVMYACAQRGDICPLMESGKTYTADRVGSVIYISMSVPEDKRPLSVKYKEVGTW